MDEDEKRLNEYKEALSTDRFHSMLLFGELTVYMAASGFLLKFVISNSLSSILNKWVVPIAGIILSLAFFVISERAGDFLHSARNTAKDLEKKLGFSLCSNLPKRKTTAINAIRVLYSLGLIIWLTVLFEGCFNLPVYEYWILKLLVSCSYLFIILGSTGMIFFATKFPFSANIKDLKYCKKKVFCLNGYQVWMFSWGLILIGAAIQLIAFWAN